MEGWLIKVCFTLTIRIIRLGKADHLHLRTLWNVLSSWWPTIFRKTLDKLVGPEYGGESQLWHMLVHLQYLSLWQQLLQTHFRARIKVDPFLSLSSFLSSVMKMGIMASRDIVTFLQMHHIYPFPMTWCLMGANSAVWTVNNFFLYFVYTLPFSLMGAKVPYMSLLTSTLFYHQTCEVG